MKYRCNHCDITFESEKKDKVRCPECMGIHDVEPAGEKRKEGDGPKPKPRLFVPAILVLIAIAGAIIYVAIQKNNDNKKAAPTLTAGSVKEQMKSLGIEMADVVVPFESSDAIDKFAAKAADGKTDGDAVKSIYEHLLNLKKNSKWEAFGQTEPRVEPPLTASELLKKIEAGKAAETTSYEMACLLYSATRSADVDDVQMVEIYNYKKEKAPADPTAIYSRYAVVANKMLFDPWGGRSEPVANVNIEVLDAAGATAPYYAHRSLSKFAILDMSDSLKDNQTAVELDPDNAIFKLHRGKIFLGSGAVQEALAEFEKAKKAKDWALTRLSLAQMYLMTQSNIADAEATIRDAIAEFPEYHQAHALLATMYMMKGDAKAAEQELTVAEKMAPASPEIAAVFAQLYAMTSDSEKAIQYAQKTVRLSKENFQSLMILAQVYRATARFDKMREVARKAFEKAPSEAVREELRNAFQIGEDDEEDDENNSGEAGSDVAEGAETEDDVAAKNAEMSLDLPAVLPSGNLKLNLKNDSSSLGSGKLKLGSGKEGQGLGGDLQLDMNQ